MHGRCFSCCTHTCIITGSQEDEEPYLCQAPEDSQAEPAQEVQAQEEDPEELLPECPDHRPSVFEQGKPRSIPNPNF